MMKPVFCVILSVFGWITAFAQYENLKFENFSTLEGLSSSTCLEIFEDSEGYLWFGTINGLNKYDGYDFKIYRPMPGDRESISSNRILSIEEDREGHIWVGTGNGLNMYNPLTDKFARIRLKQVKGGLEVAINDLEYDSLENKLWVATDQGLYLLYLKDEVNISYEMQKYTYLKGEQIAQLEWDKSGDLWAAGYGPNIFRYDQSSNSFSVVKHQLPEELILNHLPQLLMLDSKGNFLIGNNLEALSYWDREADEIRLVKITSQKIPINDLHCDKNGITWVSTGGFGLYLLDENMSLLQHITHNPQDPFSLPNNQPSRVTEDRDGIYWISTYNRGICKLSLEKSTFRHIRYESGNPMSLSSEIAQSVLVDEHENIWIGTDGGGLNLWRDGAKKIEYFTEENGAINSNKVVYLAQGDGNKIWVCTWDGGLSLFDPATGTSRVFLHDPNDPTTIGQNTASCAAADAQGRTWLGTNTAGINVYVPKEDRFYRFPASEESGIQNNMIVGMMVDRSNRLLIGARNGLQVVDINAIDELTSGMKLPMVDVSKSGLEGFRVTHITQAADGTFWLGTDQGLYHITNELELVRSYTTSDGLINNLVVGVVAYDENTIWMTSKGGLSRLDVPSGKIKNFNVQDGIQGSEFQSKSVDLTPSGHILAGGINGLNIFDPRQIADKNKTVSPRLTALKIHNQEIHVGDTLSDRVVLSTSLEETEKIKLYYDEGFIQFDFVALNYSNPNRVSYAHRMVGISDEWVHIQNGRSAGYSNLTAGDYTFEVMAALDGDWDAAGITTINLEVLPPPWKSWWAYMIYLTFFVVVVWQGFRFYAYRINEERAHELDQMKLRFFMNVSHEFRTPLTLILNPVDKLLSSYDNPEVVKSSALVIQRSARKLLNLVNQLLDFRKLDMGQAPLDPVKGDIIKFTEDIHRFFTELANSRSIKFDLITNRESYFMWFDPDKLEKILGNLLSNAIKFTGDGGKISLEINIGTKRGTSVDVLEIIVRDSGIGLKKDQLEAVFNRFFHVDNTMTGTGIGLHYTKSLVEQHGGEITAESEYGEGSTFTVSIPTENAALDIALKSNQGVRKEINDFDQNSLLSLEYDLAISAQDDVDEEVDGGGAVQTVLIVEDNNELRVHLKNELGSLYRIKGASNGKEGLEKARKFFPDIIISDVMMPEMDGFEMCSELKGDPETSHIPIILLTARSLEEDRAEGYSIGADAYLPKPFNITVLKVRIKNLLQAKRKMREKFMKQTNILPSSEVTTNTLDEQFLDKATQVVLDNISDSDFNLKQMLDAVGVSRSHFYRKIQSLTGQNPSHFIRSVRLKYAAELLKQHNCTIKEVAFKSGFNSTAYFSKTFRELFEMTPNEFMESNKGK
ncbi:hybrid sensor histidine kinase/response regulator transcription factor [Marinoscillum furvescens]|uniref:histidine kinase n=1 Tax=Marinoscillum furvescens DSM 4134 TaxID=1122208 RepID=A0A3D9L7E9_MARFU|nr:two-component regulator propeller domain-containing protein [Marinoscillum furvescens]REE02002.1 signal transduction histidine kinase [Marinoscillum furvescens DSM 4134]